ncbi:LysR substrate-binding domain-containing protein [Sphingobium boeckii]|uniref:LysR family glycine cleavage system transcriptional activator n=1 Tax=Sphingobium boeckii TaxID=1082345 RepID=A0A7W9AJF8_9SPHN|nr:LysR substrate-binding domain-containing protein [Sphingobium boeckii]MBB5686576.1 LysR family glycine cleavage system transcriptional activator [Sphingobium boeckii]
MRRLPPLTALEAFLQVARLGSIKAAAEDLSLSSPALSRRVQALERFLGRQLFERRHQALVLTSDGEKLLHNIAPAIDSLSLAIDEMSASSDVMKIRLGILPLFASQKLMPQLPELRALHPELHLDIDTAAHALTRLGEGLDVAIPLAREIDPALYARRLGRNMVYPIAGRMLTEGPNAIREPRDLARATVLLHRDMPETFETFKNALGLNDLEPASIDHFDSGQLMLEAAAGGLGVAFMLDSHLEDSTDERLVRLFDVDVESVYSYWFACRPRALELRPVRIFHDWMVEKFEG